MYQNITNSTDIYVASFCTFYDDTKPPCEWQNGGVHVNLPDHCRISVIMPSLFATRQQISKEQS